MSLGAGPLRESKKRALPEVSALASADPNCLSDFYYELPHERESRRRESCFYLHRLVNLGATCMDGTIDEWVREQDTEVELGTTERVATLPPPTPTTSGVGSGGLLASIRGLFERPTREAFQPAIPYHAAPTAAARTDTTASHWGSSVPVSSAAHSGALQTRILPSGTAVVVDTNQGRMKRGVINGATEGMWRMDLEMEIFGSVCGFVEVCWK